jgi:hypothetical protein
MAHNVLDRDTCQIRADAEGRRGFVSMRLTWGRLIPVVCSSSPERLGDFIRDLESLETDAGPPLRRETGNR